MVYSSKDFNHVDFCRDSAKYASIMTFAALKVERLCFLYQAEDLPKNISIEELTFPSVVELNLQHNSTEFMIRFPQFNGCYID